MRKSVQLMITMTAVLCGTCSLFAVSTNIDLSTKATVKYTNDWHMMREIPIPFPDVMLPAVPEAFTNCLALGKYGKDTIIVIPNTTPPTNNNGWGFLECVSFVQTKIGNSIITNEGALTASDWTNKNLLVFGTSSTIAAKVGTNVTGFLSGTTNYGYHIKMYSNPSNLPGVNHKVVLALGNDWPGASAAAQIMYFSICKQQTNDLPYGPSGTISNWPVAWVTNESFWLPFEAKYTNTANKLTVTNYGAPMPAKPAIPKGIRCWGGPIPTLQSWQKLVKKVKALGADTIIVQSGGWVDLNYVEDFYTAALDIAQAEGVYVDMYVGNETLPSHHAFAWTNNNFTRIISAISNHPALLHFALYNQLTSLDNMLAGEQQVLDDQITYLCTNTAKAIDIEVCGDQSNRQFWPNKIALLEHLRDQGVGIITTDVAPIGGWSNSHDPMIWETRLDTIHDLELIPMSVIQTHIPFDGPHIPLSSDVMLQFWLGIASGSRGYFYETAYCYNHYSIRGLLGWDLEVLPDLPPAGFTNRASAVSLTLTNYLPKMTNMLMNSKKVGNAGAASGLNVQQGWSPKRVEMRMRTSLDGTNSWIILINSNTASAASFTLKRTCGLNPVTLTKVAGPTNFSASINVSTGTVLSLPPGEGVCYELPHGPLSCYPVDPALVPEYARISSVSTNADTNGFGSVIYPYLIQKSEVTIAQMEVAIASDTNIASTNNVSYWKAQVGSKAPAANITWAEAAKYCNWMTTGDAYNGAYQFDQYGNLTNVLSRDEIRLKGRIHYVLPTENEWYKAAYGSNGTWSLHVNGTSTAPSSGTNANWKSVVGRVWRTYVDVLPAGYKEQNGTYDMAGNVREMTESAYSGTVYTNLTAERVVRGGAHNSATATSISSVQRDQFTYGIRNTNVGFRTAIIIPERLDLE